MPVSSEFPDACIPTPVLEGTFRASAKAERGRCTFEINNPTDRTLQCVVRPAKGFDLVGKFKKRLTLPAGGFEKVTVITGQQEAERKMQRIMSYLSVMLIVVFLTPALVQAQAKKLRMVIGGPGFMWGIDEKVISELKEEAVDVVAYPDVPMISPAQPSRIPSWDMLKLYNIVIFGDSFYHLSQCDPKTGLPPERIRAQIPLLRRFLEEGGGIWFCGIGEQESGKTAETLNYILKELRLDAAVVGEAVWDPTFTGPKIARAAQYCWTDSIERDELTTRVRGLWYPAAISADGSMPNIPIERVGPEWRVLVRGLATAASYPLDPEHVAVSAVLRTPGKVKSSPILIAVREYERGRVVLWPMWTCYGVGYGSSPCVGGTLVNGERDGKKSDGGKLIKNLLCWLAEPSQGSKTVGTFDPKTYPIPKRKTIDVGPIFAAWANSKPGRKEYSGQYKGLIGAHSNLSDGKSNPKEMIQAAKEAGYDFIAFSESLAVMDEGKWKKLVSICDSANSERPDFIAFPGIQYMDEAGNHGITFSQKWWVKDEWRSKKYPERINYLYGFTYQRDANPNRWPPRIIIRSKENNKRPWHQALWSFFAPYCYRGGELIDDSINEYRALIGPHVFFMTAGIMAVHTARSTDEIRASSKPGLYQTYVRANSLQEVLKNITGMRGPGFPEHFPSYISQGPVIEDFSISFVGRGEGADLAIPYNNNLLVHILVRAEAGLKEVRLYDGVRMVRRFLPDGEEFDAFLTFHHESYHAYSLCVTDKMGREAVSWPGWMQVNERVHRRCGDNWNWMKTGKPRSGGGPSPSNGMEVAPHGRPVSASYGCYSGGYSQAGLVAAAGGWPVGRYIYPLAQGLKVNGKPWTANCPVLTLDFGTVGRYGIILTSRSQYDYQVEKPATYTTGAFQGPYPVVPSPWPAEFRQFVPEPIGTLPRLQGKVTFRELVETRDGGPVEIHLGGGQTNPSGKGKAILEVLRPDGSSKLYPMEKLKGDAAYKGEIPQNGYICWYGPDAPGMGGVIALTPGLHYACTRKGLRLSVFVDSPVKPGTVVSWDCIFVNGSTREHMADAYKGMGVAGEPTLYKVLTRVGEVSDQKYFLSLQSEDYGFSGRIVKREGKRLPINLPVMIRGLNPRWDAGIWYRGESKLEVVGLYRDRWGMTSPYGGGVTYESRINELQWVPVFDDGTGYCQLDTHEQDPDVFIGNFLVCDRPEVFLSLVKAERGRCTFEINNPTDRTLQCVVRPAKGFDFVGKFKKRLTLPAGGFEKVTVDFEQKGHGAGRVFMRAG